ncbi:MAG: hypothetical protein QF464_22250, partial [Myxococcota bacterium]|nr:hypothetical protein [Myxococcota bacterium]
DAGASSLLLRDSADAFGSPQGQAIDAPFVTALVATTCVPLFLALGLMGLGCRRRERLDQDRAVIEAEIEREAGRFAVCRIPPMTRKEPTEVGPESDVAGMRASDGFATDAVCRATNLAHFLGDGARERLRDALRPLAPAGRRRSETRETSLLARCILETDAEQDARFQFLALEGELEAAAATAWWEARA